MVSRAATLILAGLVMGASASAQDLPIPAPRPDAKPIPFAPRKPEIKLPKPGKPRDLACEKRLTDAGVKFHIAPAARGEGACGVAYPIAIDSLADGIKVEPETRLECRAAEALANWVEKTVIPATGVFDDKRKLTSLGNASTYVCRSRNNQVSAKISEHGTGNAIDIASFRFDDGSNISVEPRDREGSDEEAFQKAVRFGACLYFTTVLGPRQRRFSRRPFALGYGAKARRLSSVPFPKRFRLILSAAETAAHQPATTQRR